MKMKRFKTAAVFGLLFMAMTIPVRFVYAETEQDALIVQDISTDGETFFPPSDVLSDVEKDIQGEIRIHLTDGGTGTVKSGITFECVLAALIVNGNYELTEPFSETGVDLNEIENSEQLSEAAQQLADIEVSGETGITDQNGDLCFSDLSTGVYLILAEETESFDVITPTLAAIPTWNEETGEMAYQVLMEPKHTPRPEESLTEAPQTSLQDDTIYYLIGGLLCIAGSAILAFAGFWKRSKKDDEEIL